MKNSKKIINFLIVIILTSIVLYFSLKDNFSSITKLIRNMNPFWFIVALLLMLTYYLFRSLVNTLLARKFNKEYSLRQAFKMELEIAFFNGVTPFSTGGKPYEIYSLKKNKLHIADATNVAIQNFVIYQIALILLGLFALIYNNVFHVISGKNILVNLVYIGFLINTLVIIVLFIVSFAKKANKFISKKVIGLLSKLKIIKNKEETTKHFHEYLYNFHKGTEILLQNKLEFVLLVFMQVISLIAFYLIPMIILFGLGNYEALNGLESIVISAYVMLIGSFVPMPGGTGGLEYVFLVFFGTYIKGPSLNAIMLVWRFITYYFGFVVGAIIFNIRKKD